MRNVTANEAQILLGKKIERLRNVRGLTRMQLGKAINETEQQVGRFEAGGFIPINTLERIGEALQNRIPKKIIRRISDYRAYEINEKTQAPELIELYNLAFPEIED